jgi:hypothetical protein
VHALLQYALHALQATRSAIADQDLLVKVLQDQQLEQLQAVSASERGSLRSGSGDDLAAKSRVVQSSTIQYGQAQGSERAGPTCSNAASASVALPIAASTRPCTLCVTAQVTGRVSRWTSGRSVRRALARNCSAKSCSPRSWYSSAQNVTARGREQQQHQHQVGQLCI